MVSVQVMQYFEGNWPALVGVIVLLLVIVWWLYTRAAKPLPRQHRPDVLDAGAAPAQRNQALIDSAPAASAAYAIPPAAGTMAGVAEVIAAAVQDEVAAAGATAAPVDDLSRIKGVGPKLSALLASLGVTSFSQIAAWTAQDMATIDAQLGSFAGRPERDQWIEQARFLAAGDTAGYEGKFGKL